MTATDSQASSQAGLIEYLRLEMKRLHAQYDRAVRDLSEEQWHWLPNDKGNSIAFETWHYTRTEDNIVRFILQDRRPTVWLDGNYPEMLGLHRTAQGTGMPPTEAQAFHISDIQLFQEYMQQVWAGTDEWLANPDESSFATPVTVKPIGEMPKIHALGQVCLTHGFGHLGEIDHIRAMMDLPGVNI
ncbi:MAG: DinB family protein [Dehalococcoidia bacterium]